MARLIDAEPFDFNKVVIPDGGPNFMRGYGLGAKHVCDEINAAQTIDAVPLEPLCEWLAVNASYIFGGYKNTWKFEARHWEQEIREWMKDEGLDATD